MSKLGEFSILGGGGNEVFTLWQPFNPGSLFLIYLFMFLLVSCVCVCVCVCACVLMSNFPLISGILFKNSRILLSRDGSERVNTSFSPLPKTDKSPILLTNLRTYRTEDLHNRNSFYKRES